MKNAANRKRPTEPASKPKPAQRSNRFGCGTRASFSSPRLSLVVGHVTPASPLAANSCPCVSHPFCPPPSPPALSSCTASSPHCASPPYSAFATCYECKKRINASVMELECSLCQQYVHPNCVGVNEDLLRDLNSEADDILWACNYCVEYSRELLVWENRMRRKKEPHCDLCSKEASTTDAIMCFGCKDVRDVLLPHVQVCLRVCVCGGGGWGWRWCGRPVAWLGSSIPPRILCGFPPRVVAVVPHQVLGHRAICGHLQQRKCGLDLSPVHRL